MTALSFFISARGFSFLGLMLLTALLAIAGSAVMITFTSSTSNQRLNETVKKMDRVLEAIAKYEADDAGAVAPPTLAYLYTNVGPVACTTNTATSKLQGWCGPYLEEVFQEDANDQITDGWGTVFEYDNIGHNLYSWGPNKTDDAGGSDDLTRAF